MIEPRVDDPHKMIGNEIGSNALFNKVKFFREFIVHALLLLGGA